MKSGKVLKYRDRSNWALTYLRQSGLIESAGVGKSKITEAGSEYLRRAPYPITLNDLKEFEGFRNFINKSNEVSTSNDDTDSEMTPEDRIIADVERINDALKSQILENLQSVSPARFEQVVIDLMIALGYGFDELSGKVTGGPGDGGIDGIVTEDRLGLQKIYLQAKRYNSNNTVSTEAVNSFVGALALQSASKGVFITTGRFSPNAIAILRGSSSQTVRLIDGEELASLMVEVGLGTETEKQISIKRINSDYFQSE